MSAHSPTASNPHDKGATMPTIADALGEVGLPAPMAELTGRQWDAVVVGGGHNGLACAAYLARAGWSVLVLERRERLGGACTLERPFPDPRYVVSPCAYVVGLLDPVVIDELDLRRRGLEVFVADPNLWAPFEDGSSLSQWNDDAAHASGAGGARPLPRRHPGLLGVRAGLRRHAQAAAHRQPGQLDRGLAHPRRARGHARPRPVDDRHPLRGVDRRGARPLRAATSASRTRSSARA